MLPKRLKLNAEWQVPTIAYVTVDFWNLTGRCRGSQHSSAAPVMSIVNGKRCPFVLLGLLPLDGLTDKRPGIEAAVSAVAVGVLVHPASEQESDLVWARLHGFVKERAVGVAARLPCGESLVFRLEIREAELAIE